MQSGDCLNSQQSFPTPWGAYDVAPVYEREFNWAARHMATLAYEIEDLTSEALRGLHTAHPDLGQMERMLELTLDSIRGALRRIVAARNNDVYPLVYDFDIQDIPAAPSTRPGLQGGMMRQDGSPLAPQETLQEAETRLCTTLSRWLQAYRGLLMRPHTIMDDMEIQEEGLRAERFRVAYINTTRNLLGIYRDEAESVKQLATQLDEISFPWGFYVNMHYRDTLARTAHDLRHLADTMVHIWGAAWRELETVTPVIPDVVMMIEWSSQMLKVARRPIAIMLTHLEYAMQHHADGSAAGGASTCSSTAPFSISDPIHDNMFLPAHLREHRLLALTATGSHSISWHEGDEVAWCLLLAGFHPYFYVLIAFGPGFEYT